MDQFIILALLAGSLLTTWAAARGVLGLLFHLMTLGRQTNRLAPSSQLAPSAPHTPASL